MEGSLLNKHDLRKKFSLIIEQLSTERKKEASHRACQYLLDLSKEASLIASFAPFGSEIDIWPFNREMIKQKKLLLPRVSGKDLSYYRVENQADLLESQWNILEPDGIKSAPVKVDTVDFVLVPGLAFDMLKQRLGRGKGFYDIFISLHKPKVSYGLGFTEQHSSSLLPIDLHDQVLNDVLLF